jgi:hypothetical protein
MLTVNYATHNLAEAIKQTVLLMKEVSTKKLDFQFRNMR